jgi:ABC-type transport system substrate-binding protein
MSINKFLGSIKDFLQKEANRVSFFFRRGFASLDFKEKRILIVLSAIFVLLLVAQFYNLLVQRNLDTPRSGGVYKEATWGTIKSLNPFFATSQVEKDVSSILFLKLIDLNDQGKWQGVLLSKFTVGTNSADLQIRKDAYWDNGDPVTADDFIFTVDLFKTSKSFSPWQPIWKNVVITKVSDKEVKLTYPDNSLAYKNLRFPLLPQKVLSGMDLSKIQVFAFNIDPIGDGSFKFGSLGNDSGQTIITLNGNPYSFQKPYIDQMQFYVYYSLDQAVSTFKTTSFSGLAQMPIEDIPSIKDKRVSQHLLNLPQYTALFYNLKKAPLNDQTTRQMLDLAINRNQIISSLGYVNKTTLPLPSGIVNQNVSYDSKKAKSFLQPKLSTKQFTLSYPDNYLYQQTAQLLQGQLAQAGVKVNLDAEPELTLWSKMQQGNFDMVLWSESVGNALDLSSWYSTSQFNFSGFSEADVDNAIANAQTRDDSIAIAKMIAGYYPASFLYSEPYVWSSRNLQGVGNNQLGEESSDRFRDLASWYLIQNK